MGITVEEAAVDQIHRLLVEVKDYLDAKDTKKSIRLAGKVEFVLDNWNDDAFFGSDEDDDEDEGDDDEDEGDDDEDEGDDDEDDDFVNHEDDDEGDEGSILDDPEDDD